MRFVQLVVGADDALLAVEAHLVAYLWRSYVQDMRQSSGVLRRLVVMSEPEKTTVEHASERRAYGDSVGDSALEAIREMKEVEAFLKEHRPEEMMGAFEVSQRFEEWRMNKRSPDVAERRTVNPWDRLDQLLVSLQFISHPVNVVKDMAIEARQIVGELNGSEFRERQKEVDRTHRSPDSEAV